MNWIDKLLLGLLVLLLPIGLVIGFWMWQDSETEIDPDIQATQLEQVIETSLRQVIPSPTPKLEFLIAESVYASESDSLRVEGKAPAPHTITVSATVLPNGQNLPEEDQVRGQKVDIYSVRTNQRGEFVYEYDLSNLDQTEGIVQLIFSQGGIEHYLEYDLSQL